MVQDANPSELNKTDAYNISKRLICFNILFAFISLISYVRKIIPSAEIQNQW